MVRVAVSGAHQVGKSSMIRDLLARLPGAVGVGNILRGMHAEGYGIRSHTDPRTLAVYLSRQTADEDSHPHAEHLVADRVFADAAAYVQANVEAGISRHPWGTHDVELLRAVARLHASRFDLHVYVPVEFPMVDEAPGVEGSAGFRDLVDRRLRGLLSDGWPIPVMTVGGSRRDRVDRLLGAIGVSAGSPP